MSYKILDTSLLLTITLNESILDGICSILTLYLSKIFKTSITIFVLDTFCFLDKAIDIYKKFGFYEIPQYNNCPIEDTIYLKLDLIKETTINE